MDRLQSMRVFRQVVDEGGFAAAARKLELAPAVVTRLVGDLERHLGVRLLQRTTRRLALTPAGDDYLARLRVILGEIDEAESVAHSHTREMSGTVRVLTLPVLATHLLAPALADFQRRHPRVLLDLHIEDVADANVEDHDVAIVNDFVAVPSSAIARTILHAHTVFCAAPGYLQQHGEPRTPADLAQHRCLRLRMPGTRLRPLTLFDPDRPEERVVVEAPAVLTANHTDTLLRATLEGAGISSQPADLAAPWLRSGQLQRVLAPWITNRIAVIAAMPSRRFMPARTRAFVDHLVAYAQQHLCQHGIVEFAAAANGAGAGAAGDGTASSVV